MVLHTTVPIVAQIPWLGLSTCRNLMAFVASVGHKAERFVYLFHFVSFRVDHTTLTATIKIGLVTLTSWLYSSCTRLSSRGLGRVASRMDRAARTRSSTFQQTVARPSPFRIFYEMESSKHTVLGTVCLLQGLHPYRNRMKALSSAKKVGASWLVIPFRTQPIIGAPTKTIRHKIGN